MKVFNFICLFLSIGAVHAQNSKNLIDLGHAAYIKGNFDLAIDYYSKVLSQDTNHFEALLFTGIIFYSRKDYSQAISYLSRCKSDSEHATLSFYLGECYFFIEEYDKSIDYYSKFIRLSHPDFDLVKRAVEQLEHAKYAARALLMPQPVYRIPDWLVNIRSDADDHNPWLAEDDRVLYFSSDRYLDRDYDIFRSLWNGSSFDIPERLPEPLNSNNEEGEFSISRDQKTLVLTSAHWCPPQTKCHPNNKIKIYYFSNGKWSSPKLLSDNIYYYSDFDIESKQKKWYFDETIANPALSADGKKLLFSSKRVGGYGGFDLWISYLSDTGWTVPQNLGPSINTPGNEADPCLLPDGQTLFFSSTGHPGFGGYDFFLSIKESTAWSAPLNLGKPFNSSGDEFDLFVSGNGTRFWFNREVRSKRNPNRLIRQLQVIELDQPLDVLKKK